MPTKSFLAAALVGLATLSQPVFSQWTKGATVELKAKDNTCTFHFKDVPQPGCTGGVAEDIDHKPIGYVKDGKCVSKNENAAVFFLVDYCNLDVPPLASYVFRRIEGGNYDAGQVVTNNRTIPIGLEIGSKAVWNGQDWDVSKN